MSLNNFHTRTIYASQDLKELVFNNSSYTKPVDVANALNTFCSTIGPKINADMHKLAAPSFESCKLNINGFRFEQIDESIVSRMLLSLSNHTNGGMAQIPTYMYKLIAKFIVAPLTLIINQILDQNEFPDHHHHLPYSTGHFFSVLRTGLYASSPEPHECHGNGNGQANIECYISLPLALHPHPSPLSLTPHIPAPPPPPLPPPPPPHEPLKLTACDISCKVTPFGKPGYGPD